MILHNQILAEFFGTAGLLIVVVGSGIMGESLAQGNSALALLANSLATGAGLYALIQTFGPVSGAHFNPAVSWIEFLWKRISGRTLLYFAAAQTLAGIVGVGLTHVMFGQTILQLSAKDRSEPRLMVSELIATLGLILVISLSVNATSRRPPWRWLATLRRHTGARRRRPSPIPPLPLRER